jgi:hypothetical protein
MFLNKLGISIKNKIFFHDNLKMLKLCRKFCNNNKKKYWSFYNDNKFILKKGKIRL